MITADDFSFISEVSIVMIDARPSKCTNPRITDVTKKYAAGNSVCESSLVSITLVKISESQNVYRHY